MASLSRRELFRSTGILGGALALAACDTAPGGGGSDSGSSDVLRWWDHSPNLKPINQKIFERFERETGARVEYSYHQTAKMGQALQLAKQSGQLPDIHTNVGLKFPVPALIEGGWYQPLDLSDEAMARLEGSLIDGVHVFDGKPYSFPIFADKQYWAVNWFNTELLEKAGVDPQNPPTTYDEFRAAARAVRKSGGDNVYGWIWNLGMTGRIANQVHDLAQGAGFPGENGIEFRTGEYALDSESYLTVLEFLLSLQRDGLLLPGSINFNDKTARARWATGIAGFYFDGPWCAGIVTNELDAFTPKLGAGPMLVPSKGTPVTAYRGPAAGWYYISQQADNVEAANRILSDYYTTDGFNRAVAGAMAQPPRDLAAVQNAEVHPAFKKVCRSYAEDVFLAPASVVANVDVARANAEMKQVTPDFGSLIQGMFSGDVTDIRSSLKTLNGKLAKERERAIAAAREKGAEISLHDYAFPNWQPRTDYTPDMYR